jgi:hypothetical protein
MLYPCLDQCSQMKTALTTNSIPSTHSLYGGRVQHDTNRSAERLRGERRRELGADNARVSVWAGDLAPDHADLGATDLLLAAVDEGNLLAEVEVGSIGAVNTLDLDQAGAGGLNMARALVAQVATLDV